MSLINAITAPLVLFCEVHATHYLEGTTLAHLECGDEGALVNCANTCGGDRCAMVGLAVAGGILHRYAKGTPVVVRDSFEWRPAFVEQLEPNRGRPGYYVRYTDGRERPYHGSGGWKNDPVVWPDSWAWPLLVELTRLVSFLANEQRVRQELELHRARGGGA